MMESYGSYETSREIASGRGSAVFAAVRKGEPAGQFAVKVVYSSPASDDPFADAAAPGSVAAEAFLNSIAIQKKAAAASPGIAPILEDGIDPRGAWSVTTRYPRSVQKLIEGRVALNQAGVFHILQAIVAGLLGMKKSCGRSHGRLHAGNVLIGAGTTLGDAQVHLTDCAPDGIEPGRCELADLRAIGLILYQLVRKREVSEDDDWVIVPLEASKEWTDLFGASTGAWLEIGNALLDRNLSLDRYNLEKLSSALVALQPKPPVSRRTLMLAAAVLLLGVAGLLFFVWSSGWTTIQIAIVGPGGVDGPGDARVMVDGQPAKSKPPTGSRRQLKVRKNRSYEFEVSHGDLAPFKTNLIVDGKSGQSLELPLIFGNLVVEGVTPGAEFALTNGATVITGNTTGNYTNAFAKPGLWKLALRREGFVSAVLETNVQAGQTSVLQALLKARDPGKVLVEFVSLPSGATVTVIDGGGNTVETMKTGEGKSEIKPGKYTLSASYPFWDRRQVQTIPFEILLQPDQTNVNFVFSNVRFALVCEDPPGATVTVTNRFLGEPSATNFMTTTPVSLLNWPTGMFVFHFEAAGYFTTNLTVTLLAGATQVTARLIPMLGFADLRTDLPAFITNVVNGECIATNQADIPTVIGLKPGKNYKLRATPLGFPGIPAVEVGDLTFEKGQTNLVPFKFAFRRVALTSDPAGAEIIDPFGTNVVPVTSLSVLPLGTTNLTARHPRYGFDPETELVSLVRGRTIPVLFKFKYGTVIVTSFPSGLVVRGTNGQSLGRTPYTNSFAPYGTAVYQIFYTNPQPREVKQ